VDDDAGAGGGESLGKGAAHAMGGAGDQCAATLEDATLGAMSLAAVERVSGHGRRRAVSGV
jgi:hypothetical protein